MSLELNRGEALDRGLKRLARERWAAVHTALSGRPADAADVALRVHDSRKRLKELRAVLRLLRGQLDDRSWRGARDRARTVAGALAGARDAEVMARTLRALGGGELPASLVAADPWEQGSAAKLAKRARAGARAVDEWRLAGQGWSLVGQGLRRTWRQGRDRARRARHAGHAEDLHAWRSQVKASMYQLRLFQPAWPAVLGPLEADLHELGDVLGDHHDLHVLLQALGSSLGPAVLDRAAQRQQALESRAWVLGTRLYGLSPGGWEGMLEGAWRAWTLDSGAAA